jgi:hypothetical protein
MASRRFVFRVGAMRGAGVRAAAYALTRYRNFARSAQGVRRRSLRRWADAVGSALHDSAPQQSFFR